MRRRPICTLATVAVVAACWLATSEASAAPTKIRFLDVDSASHDSFVGVYGSGFGATKGRVTLGGTRANDVPLWTDTLIIARVPTGAQTGVVAVTTQGGQPVESQDTLRIHDGSVYVVSTAGDDTAAGDESAPFRSLHKAMSVLQPGDTVLVRAGSYDEQDPSPDDLPELHLLASRSGTTDKPVTWRGFGADLPVVRGTGAPGRTPRGPAPDPSWWVRCARASR
jgi:hypothetical protein